MTKELESLSGDRLRSPKRSFAPLKTLVGLLVAYSLLTTGLISVFIWKRGGLGYVSEQLGLTRVVHVRTDWQKDAISRFALYPNTAQSVVFAGDSITAGVPWAEYFSRIKNRGVGGETSSGLLSRIESISSTKPQKLFLNIGTNDLSKDIDLDEIMANIADMINQVHRLSPQTAVYVISVLPTNPDFDGTALSKRKYLQISALNNKIAAQQTPLRFTYLNVSDSLKDNQGYLRKTFTIDGTHLNGRGERVYAQALAPYVIDKSIDRR